MLEGSKVLAACNQVSDYIQIPLYLLALATEHCPQDMMGWLVVYETVTRGRTYIEDFRGHIPSLSGRAKLEALCSNIIVDCHN